MIKQQKKAKIPAEVRERSGWYTRASDLPPAGPAFHCEGPWDCDPPRSFRPAEAGVLRPEAG
jgi:hypothetical protein